LKAHHAASLHAGTGSCEVRPPATQQPLANIAHAVPSVTISYAQADRSANRGKGPTDRPAYNYYLILKGKKRAARHRHRSQRSCCVQPMALNTGCRVSRPEKTRLSHPLPLVNYSAHRAGMGSLFPPTSPSDQIRTGNQVFPRQARLYHQTAFVKSHVKRLCEGHRSVVIFADGGAASGLKCMPRTSTYWSRVVVTSPLIAVSFPCWCGPGEP